ncbi:hypothetical protein HII36_53025, partial [Nonomuraea sp. NN258]|nr:hypothetical protein [Nonomuraea antri]
MGGFSLLGRLREDGPGPVFLARDAYGAEVEIAWPHGDGPGDGGDRVERVVGALAGLRAPSLARVVA